MTTELANFWNHKHPLAAFAAVKYEELVPVSGNCATLQGELLRASSRISHDWFNYGWGCNNWSGAVQFINKYFEQLQIQTAPEVLKKLIASLKEVNEYSHGEPCHISDERADILVTNIHEIIVQAVMDNPKHIVNTDDMFNHQEEDYRDDLEDENEFDQDDDDEEYNH